MKIKLFILLGHVSPYEIIFAEIHLIVIFMF